jgi:hypothetical protein
MKAKQMKRNRLWGMAVVAVLLFVALAVMPVAAADVIYTNTAQQYHKVYVPVANPDAWFPYSGPTNDYYYINLTNATGGMNAIHITNSTTNMAGTCYKYPDAGTSGTFFVGDTGGRGGQDDVILLVAVNSTDPTVLGNFSIDITASGYQWTPSADGTVPNGINDTNWITLVDAMSFNSTNYLKNATYGNPLFQEWKFAPTADYPIYCGQTMGGNANLFKLIAIDTDVGTINGTWYYNTYGTTLTHDNGLANITFTITSPSPFNTTTTKVAFNVYAYNNQTVQGQGINWINKVYKSGGSTSGTSGWLVGTP